MKNYRPKKEGIYIVTETLLKKMQNSPENKQAMVGFDGYIDSILRVNKSDTKEQRGFFPTMESFGTYVQSKAQKSCSLELQLVTEKLGGNMPIFAKALGCTGLSCNCVGALGYPEIHPKFAPLQQLGEVLSICQPGTCEALEFDDGKLMLARNEDISALNFTMLKERAGLQALINLAGKADLIAILNWSELMGSTSIWKGYLEEVFPKLPKKHREIFVDLSDCSQRPAEDLLEMLELLKEFSKFGSVSLSLNRNESERLGAVLGIGGGIMELTMRLYSSIGCTRLIIHLLDGCFCMTEEGLSTQKNRFIEKPKLSTGGGDNFNAGFAYGLLCGLEPKECMVVANGFSGYYVSNGESPTKEQLIEWLREELNRKDDSYEEVREA